MLVLLRVTIGWHFYSEGVDKYAQGDWDAKPFFSAARGPFADRFRQLVWDHDGTIRLNEERTKIHWARFRDRAAKHFGFDEAQVARAQANYSKAVDQYKWVVSQNSTEIEEYELGRERIRRLDADRRRDGVSSLAAQRETIRSEWTRIIGPTLSQIDSIWEHYEKSQNALATDTQSKRRPPLKMGVPRTQAMDTSVINAVVPYFDMAIGVGLILGLFTPVAALAAAGFLGSVFLSQFPPTTGPTSTYYQLVEGVACLVLAGTAAGRFAGLDFVLQMIVRKFWPQTSAH